MRKSILILLTVFTTQIVSAQSATIIQLPNLTPNEGITISDVLIEGIEMTFSTSVINNGSVDAGSFINHFYIDLHSDGYAPGGSDVVIGELVPGLSVNSTIDFSKSWTAIEGTHLLRVLTDGTNSVVEDVESDNSSEWISFTVSSAREFGVYGRAWQDYVLNTSVSMNSIIYQFADSNFLTTAERVQEVFELLSNGHQVIINLALKDRDRLYFSTEQFIDRVDSIIQNANISSLNLDLDFSLGEENAINSVSNPTAINGFNTIFDYLEFLHDTLSVHYPNHNFKQWYSPRCNFIHQFEEDPVGYDALKTPYINNDGWVYDHYNFGINDYNNITDLYGNDNLQNGTKTSSVIWASPDWIRLTSDDVSCDSIAGTDANILYSQYTWWNEVGWRYFYNNIAKNIERDISTYFFMYTKNTDNGLAKPLFHNDASQCHYDFLNYIEAVTIPYLKSNNIPLEVPAIKPYWIPTFDFNSCGCEENVFLSNLIYSETYQVSNEIISNGYIPESGNAMFKANTVVLDPSFEVKLAADFSVIVNPCQ